MMDREDWGIALEKDLARGTSAPGTSDLWPGISSSPWASEDGFPPGHQGELGELTAGDEPQAPLPSTSELEERRQLENGVQTDPWRTEKGLNTELDWESRMRSVEDYSAQLAVQYEALLKQKEEEEAELGGHVDSLEQKKKEGIQQQQGLIDKIESLRVKLKLNCCKTTRKNFTAKKQELTAEKSRMEEEKNRLSQELEETDRKLMMLMEEQNEEKLCWERELAELRKDMDPLQKEAEESSQTALQDEIAALEMQRDVTISEVEDWIADADRFLHTLRLDPSPQYIHQSHEWEKNVTGVCNSLAVLQRQFSEQLHLLRTGHQRENLPAVTTPFLPQVPTVELLMGPMMYPPVRPPFPHVLMEPSPMARPFSPQYHSSVTAPVRSIPSPVPPSIQPASTPPPQPTGPHVLPSSTPPPAGKLDMLLEKLGVRFPHCTRDQLTAVLQQIKMSRGTMAGMSMEEVTQHVAQRLKQIERPALGPIRPPFASRGFPGPTAPLQRASHSSERAAVTQVFHVRPPQPASVRKLCMMCQNHVDPESQHPMRCSHTLHKECISVWLRSSKNNSCPFCPSK